MMSTGADLAPPLPMALVSTPSKRDDGTRWIRLSRGVVADRTPTMIGVSRREDNGDSLEAVRRGVVKCAATRFAVATKWNVNWRNFAFIVSVATLR